MSPELLNPRVQNHYPTKHSECFSLGMVIYEVLSQCVPFYPYANSTVFEKMMQGDRPERPGGVEGEWFTDVIWALLERCWVYTPQNRPSVDNVLLCLERTSRCWIPYPPAPPFATASTTGSFARRHSDKSTIVRTNWANTIKVLLQLDESSPQFPQQLHQQNRPRAVRHLWRCDDHTAPSSTDTPPWPQDEHSAPATAHSTTVTRSNTLLSPWGAGTNVITQDLREKQFYCT